MIHVGVREQDEIRAWAAMRLRPTRGAGSRFGQQSGAINFEEDGAVAQPGGVQARIGPGRRDEVYEERPE